MGTDCQIIVVGPQGDAHAARGEREVQRLERLWSRFNRDSEVSRLRSTESRLSVVTAETFALIERSVLAWRVTGGRFDPTMADHITDLGYSASFEQLQENGSDRRSAESPKPRPAAGCSDIALDRDDLTVSIPPGVGFDAGGIGKGLAADMVSAELIGRGAWGVMVNLGGDLRVRGSAPCGEAWVVTINEPAVRDGELATVRLVDAGLATSTTRKRRWETNDGEKHHLLDPKTGQPDESGVDLVTSIAGEAWWAEVTATTLIGTPKSGTTDSETSKSEATDSETPVPPGCSALRVLTGGEIERLADFERYEA